MTSDSEDRTAGEPVLVLPSAGLLALLTVLVFGRLVGRPGVCRDAVAALSGAVSVAVWMVGNAGYAGPVIARVTGYHGLHAADLLAAPTFLLSTLLMARALMPSSAAPVRVAAGGCSTR